MKSKPVTLFGKEEETDELRRELERLGGYNVEVHLKEHNCVSATFDSRVLVGEEEIRQILLGES